MLLLSFSASTTSESPLQMAMADKESMILASLLTISSERDLSLSQSFDLTSRLVPLPSIKSDSTID